MFDNFPICDACWKLRCERAGTPGRVPVRIVDVKKTSCSFCGETTKSGIFVRENSASIPFPTPR